MNTPDQSANLPAKCMANLAGRSEVTAIDGSSYAFRTRDVAERVDRHAEAVTGTKVLIDMACQQELSAGRKAQDILAEMETYWSARKAAGYDLVVAVTVPDATMFTSAANRERAALNDMIRWSTVADAVADIAALAEMQDATNKTYFGDGIHITSATTTLIEPVVTAAIEGVLRVTA